MGTTLDGADLGIYRLGAELGRGGMGTVYRAESTAEGPAGPAGAAVAVKVFHDHLVEDENAFTRFQREAEIGIRISHPHLVRTHELGATEVDGKTCHWMAMELIEGRTLKQLAEDLGTVPEQLLFSISDQALDALQVMHERGVVHRDIKPENIVITADHRVLLMDLGVARLDADGYALTQAGEFVGSLPYAAPEQFMQQDEIGPRTDLYAFGITLYELATGQNPYDAGDLGALLQRKLKDELTPPRTVLPDLDAFWDEVICTCSRREMAARFASAAELRSILRQGEESTWWRQRRAGLALPSGDRALKRLRLERQAPLVGRDADLDRLRGAAAAAQADGRVVLVGGPAGVGKSRLLYEFLASLVSAEGPSVLAGRCVGAGGRSYQPFLEAVFDLLDLDDVEPERRREVLSGQLAGMLADSPGAVEPFTEFLLGGLQPGTESGFSKDAVHAAFAGVLRASAADRPLILAVEDLHLADADTRELFAYVARCVAGHRILLVGTYADDEIEGGDLAADAALHTLPPLAFEPCEELVRAVVRHEKTVHALGHRLHSRSDGNPFVVLELIAYLRESGRLAVEDHGLAVAGPLEDVELPATVRDVAGLKLGRLDEEERETLEAAAVIGLDFGVDLLAAVLEEESIELLQRLAVLERKHRLLSGAGKHAFRFASRQLYEAVYGDINEDLRTEYHALVADTLLERAEDEEPAPADAYALLRHLHLAERTGEAEPFIEPALDHMASHFHAGFAAPFLEGVAEALAGAQPQTRLALAMTLWALYELLADRAAQLRVLETAQAVADELGEPGARGRVRACLAATHFYAGNTSEALTEAGEGLELARKAGDRKWESNALHLLGALSFVRGEPHAAEEHWRSALAIRREIADRRGEASTLQGLAAVLYGMQRGEESLALKREALAISREIADRRMESGLLGNTANSLADAHRYDEAIDLYQRAIDVAREIGNHAVEARSLSNMANFLAVTGRIEEAEERFDRALAIWRDVNNLASELATLTLSSHHLGAFGRTETARRRLESAIVMGEQADAKQQLARAHLELGGLLHEAGERAEAWQHLDKALALETEIDIPSRHFVALSAQANARLREADFARAAGLLEEALTLVEEIPPDSARALAMLRLARAYKGLDREEEAEALATDAERLLHEIGSFSPEEGPEIYWRLWEVRGDDESLTVAKEALAARTRTIRNAAYKDFFMTRSGPNREIMDEARRVLGK